MANFITGGGAGAGDGGFPSRNSRSSFNDPSMMIPERGAPPHANGILQSRPAPPAALQRDDSFSGSISGSRGHGANPNQPKSEVFMVREASRGNLISSMSSGPGSGTGGNSDRLPFTGASADPLNLGGGGEHASTHSNGGGGGSVSKSSRHGRADRGDRDSKETTKLVLPKMLKIAVIGESTSGKTGICNAFTSEGYSFSRNYHMTTGVSISAKSIKLPANRAGAGDSADGGGGPSSEDSLTLEPRINLVLVDSAGKPLYRELLPQYWDQLDGFALVIDLTSSTALESAPAWLNLAKDSMKVTKSRHMPGSDDGDQGGSKRGGGGQGMDSSILGVLIGSKSDLKEQRVISPKTAQDFASQQGLQYFECSAKENSGMEEPFFYLAHQWAITTGSCSSVGSYHHHPDKENSSNMEGSPAGGIYPKNPSRKSAFASRQSSSEAL